MQAAPLLPGNYKCHTNIGVTVNFPTRPQGWQRNHVQSNAGASRHIHTNSNIEKLITDYAVDTTSSTRATSQKYISDTNTHPYTQALETYNPLSTQIFIINIWKTLINVCSIQQSCRNSSSELITHILININTGFSSIWNKQSAHTVRASILETGIIS